MEGVMTFEGLTYGQQDYSAFTSVHYFASDLGAPDSKVLLQIIRSIRVVRRHLGRRDREWEPPGTGG